MRHRWDPDAPRASVCSRHFVRVKSDKLPDCQFNDNHVAVSNAKAS